MSTLFKIHKSLFHLKLSSLIDLNFNLNKNTSVLFDLINRLVEL